jgi:Uma2 family endonuclease
MSVSSQSSLLLSARWEPQPDLAVLRNPDESARDWIATARDTLLVIEVCDTSLERDRDIKIPRYAREGIAEAWLVDVNSETITSYRNPLPAGYANAVVAKRGETLRPVHIPSCEITVDEILD